jgi:tungstate transport system ATP-binding protein
MSALVQINDLLVRRGGRTALEVDSLAVQGGEVLALVGPNGAGKSTLLLALARLIKLQRGTIVFANRVLSEWNVLEYRRKIAFVFQDPLLLDFSVAENVALGLRFRGVGREEINTRVNRWLKQLGIEALAKRRAGELSGGEAQRASLARAFVLDPDLLLLDEPFSALDPPTHAKLLEDLTSLLAIDHRTTILVTHNLKEAGQFGDRVAIIVDRRLRQVGPARQIQASPVDSEVAAFLNDLSD